VSRPPWASYGEYWSPGLVLASLLLLVVLSSDIPHTHPPAPQAYLHPQTKSSILVRFTCSAVGGTTHNPPAGPESGASEQ